MNPPLAEGDLIVVEGPSLNPTTGKVLSIHRDGTFVVEPAHGGARKLICGFEHDTWRLL